MAPGRRRFDVLRRGLRHRLDRGTVLQVRGALRDHLLAGREALRHHPAGPDRAVGDDRPLHRAIARPDHEQGRIALRIAGHCLLRHEDCRGLDRLRELRGHIHARQQDRLRIWEARANRHGPCALVDDNLAELDRPGVAVDRAVRELQPHLRAGRNGAALRQRLAQVEQCRGRLLNVDIDRVQPGDGCQRVGLVRSDQRTLGDVRQADPPADRRRHPGEAHVDLRSSQRGTVLRDRSVRLAGLGECVGVILFGDCLHFRERRITLRASPGRDCARSGALQIGGRLRLLSGIDAGVDLIKRLTLADERSLGKQPFEDHARNLRPDVGHLVGRDASRQLLLDRSTALLDDDKSDRRRPARPTASTAAAVALRIAGATAPGEQQHGCDEAKGQAETRTLKNHCCGQFRLWLLNATPTAARAVGLAIGNGQATQIAHAPLGRTCFPTALSFDNAQRAAPFWFRDFDERAARVDHWTPHRRVSAPHDLPS